MPKATVTLNLGSSGEAQALAEALRPDSEGFLDVEVAGSLVTLHAESGSLLGLLRTLDDALSAVRASGLLEDE